MKLRERIAVLQKRLMNVSPLIARLKQNAGTLIDRRVVLRGLAVGSIAGTGAMGFALPAFAEKDVAIEKLMAPGELADITIGNKDAKVTIVEYSSMSCPHCAAFHKTVLPKLKEKYIDTGKVLLVFREFPLNEIAVAVSMLTRCAGDNDKTAALVEVYFEHQENWLIRGNAEPKLLELAKQAGFTQESFTKCLENADLYNNLVKQRDLASKEFGVSRTPSFFVNGKALAGNIMDVETFAKVIDPLLKESS